MARPFYFFRDIYLLHTMCAVIVLLCLSGCANLPSNVHRTPSTALQEPYSTPLGQLVSDQRKLAKTPYPSGFMLLGGAQAAYTSRLALIQSAQKTLDIQYYAIHADTSTTRLLQEVIRAAERGVRVRVLLDDFHSAGKDAQVMRLAFVKGIEMRMFNPVMGARNSPPLRAISTLTDFARAQQRMHNKLFIADNAIGIAGGRNLGDAYFDGLDSDNFVDLDIMAAGRVVQQLSRSFDLYWNDSRAYPVESLLSISQLDRMLSRPSVRQEDTVESVQQTDGERTQKVLLDLPAMDLHSVPWIWAPGVVLVDQPAKIAQPEIGNFSIVEYTQQLPEKLQSTPLIPRSETSLKSLRSPSKALTTNQATLSKVMDPVDAQSNVVDGLLTLIGLAEQRLLIVSPYFVPGEDMKAAFRAAIQRGVLVRILTNSLASNDAPVAHAGYARHRKELLEMGVELYEMRSLQSDDISTLRSTAKQVAGSTGQSRAMLHSKLMVVDGQITVVGSMNLDMRSQLQNTEIALLVASRKLSEQARTNINSSLAENAWRVMLDEQGKLVWKAPAHTDWGDQTSEPDASWPLRMLIRLIGPLAPDHLL